MRIQAIGAALLALALALLPAGGGVAAAAVAVPAEKPGPVQDESGTLTVQQAQTLAAALARLTHARYKALVVTALGNDPDAYLDAVWSTWQPGSDAVLLVAGTEGGRLRLQLGQGVGSGYGVDITALARAAYNPRAAAGDLAGGLQALAEAIDAQLATGGAPAVAPAAPAPGAANPARPAPRPWHNPFAGVPSRYWWLVAAIVQAAAAVALALWARMRQGTSGLRGGT